MKKAQKKRFPRNALKTLICFAMSTVVALVAMASTSFAQDKLPDWEAERRTMVHYQIKARGIENKSVLAALFKVERHQFVPDDVQTRAYDDYPLPIGFDQTISQPYVVALMTQLADIHEGDRVLEVGTGSGYQAAILSEMVGRHGDNRGTVISLESHRRLAWHAKQTLDKLGYQNVEVHHADGYRGWIEGAPYDAIVVTASPTRIPEALKQQLRVGGRLIIPVGRTEQQLMVVERKTDDTFSEKAVQPVKFVPMQYGLRPKALVTATESGATENADETSSENSASTLRKPSTSQTGEDDQPTSTDW